MIACILHAFQYLMNTIEFEVVVTKLVKKYCNKCQKDLALNLSGGHEAYNNKVWTFLVVDVKFFSLLNWMFYNAKYMDTKEGGSLIY